MPSPPPPRPPPREPVAVTSYLWVGIVLMELAMFVAYLSGLGGYDILEALMMPFIKSCGWEGLLVTVGWAPPPKRLTRLQRVSVFLRKILPGGKKPVKNTLGAWTLQSAKDTALPVLKKGAAVLSTHYVLIGLAIGLLALLGVSFKILAVLCDVKDEIREVRRNDDDANARIIDMIRLDLVQRLDAIERRLVFQARAASTTSPGLISRAIQCVQEHYDACYCFIMDGIP